MVTTHKKCADLCQLNSNNVESAKISKMSFCTVIFCITIVRSYILNQVINKCSNVNHHFKFNIGKVLNTLQSYCLLLSSCQETIIDVTKLNYHKKVFFVIIDNWQFMIIVYFSSHLCATMNLLASIIFLYAISCCLSQDEGTCTIGAGMMPPLSCRSLRQLSLL